MNEQQFQINLSEPYKRIRYQIICATSGVGDQARHADLGGFIRYILCYCLGRVRLRSSSKSRLFDVHPRGSDYSSHCKCRSKMHRTTIYMNYNCITITSDNDGGISFGNFKFFLISSLSSLDQCLIHLEFVRNTSISKVYMTTE